MAFVELYKEDLCDLLCTKGDGMVDIREHPDQVGMATFPSFRCWTVKCIVDLLVVKIF